MVVGSKGGYTPTCHLGKTDCVMDPAYIQYNYPDWYKELYGNLKPEQAAEEECAKHSDPDWCYDDEDK